MTDYDERMNILRMSRILRDLPRDALDAISQASRDLLVPQNTVIFRAGDPGDNFYIICSGKVRIYRKHEEGMEVDLSLLGPGGTFGEMALITGELRAADVEALEATHLMVLSKDQFDRLMRDFPDISRIFVKEMRSWLLTGDKRLEMAAHEEYRASRLSWFDFLVVMGVSVILAMIFNYSNPNGIPLFPDLPDRSSFAHVSASDAKEEAQRGEALILDAMPDNFYQKRHIKGAVSMPLGLFDIVYMMTFSEGGGEKKIIVYGRTISRFYDLEVANKLLLRGHADVRILEGGLEAWEARGYPIEEKANK